MSLFESVNATQAVGSPPPEQDQPLSAVSALVGSVGASQEERPHGVASTGGRRVILVRRTFLADVLPPAAFMNDVISPNPFRAENLSCSPWREPWKGSSGCIREGKK